MLEVSDMFVRLRDAVRFGLVSGGIDVLFVIHFISSERLQHHYNSYGCDSSCQQWYPYQRPCNFREIQLLLT
jgi:hypothetical protein